MMMNHRFWADRFAGISHKSNMVRAEISFSVVETSSWICLKQTRTYCVLNCCHIQCKSHFGINMDRRPVSAAGIQSPCQAEESAPSTSHAFYTFAYLQIICIYIYIHIISNMYALFVCMHIYIYT